MKRILFLFAFAILLRADSRHILRASFPDGTGLEIFTETTGSSPIDAGGEMGIGPGVGHQDLVNRVVVDRARNILFVYNLEASRGANPNTVMIRIEPISAATEKYMLENAVYRGQTFPSGHLPTVASVREFPAVKMGEAVMLDILYNPSTGEKIFDVLKPIAPPMPGMSVSAADAPETVALKDIAIRVNGVVMPAPASFIIGAAIRIDIPRHGTYVLAAYDPHEGSNEHGFAAIAHAEGKTLSWSMGGDHVEMSSSTNILPRSGKGVLWVFHDPHYQPDVVGLQAADTVEWLFPSR
jgi:hypothetical protein